SAFDLNEVPALAMAAGRTGALPELRAADTGDQNNHQRNRSPRSHVMTDGGSHPEHVPSRRQRASSASRTQVASCRSVKVGPDFEVPTGTTESSPRFRPWV